MITPVVQRWRDRVGSYRLSGETIATRLYEVAPILEDRVAKAFVLRHHYEGSYPAARVRVGLFRGADLVGVAVFSQPVRDLVLRPLPGPSRLNVELGRFVLLDDVPANGETWFLARSFQILRDQGIEGVVSFSDPSPRTTAAGAVSFRGHVGTIYQASNGVYLGRARTDTRRLLSDGRVLHNRALAKVRKRDRGWRYVVDQLVAYGARPPASDEDLIAWLASVVPTITRKERHQGNHKYAWGLTRSIRRSLPPSIAYPKFEGRHAA